MSFGFWDQGLVASVLPRAVSDHPDPGTQVFGCRGYNALGGEGHFSARDCMVGFPTPSWGALALGLCVLAGGIQQLVWTLTRQDGAPRYLGGPPSPRSAPVPQRE